VITALVAAADLLLRVEALEHEIDRAGEYRNRCVRRDAGAVREIDQALDTAGLCDDVGRGDVVAEVE